MENTIQFDLRRLPQLEGNNEAVIVPVIPCPQSVKAETIIQRINHSCTVTPSDIKAVLEALAEVTASELANGHTVEIPEFGSLAVRIKSTGKIEDTSSRLNAFRLKISGITFRPKRALLKRIGSPRFHRTAMPHSERITPEREKVIDLLQDYFTQPNIRYMTRAVFQQLTGLGRTEACRLLRELTEVKVLIKDGPRNCPIYTLN